jgi:hypothetical protein
MTTRELGANLHATVQQARRAAAAHNRADGLEDLSPVVPTLCRSLRQHTQVGGDEVPFFIADIAGIGASVHPSILRAPTHWFITRS